MLISYCDSKNFVNFLLIILLINISDAFGYAASSDKERCEEINIPMCRGIGYNYTSMPNQFHHDTQEEAGLEGKIKINLYQMKIMNLYFNLI